MQCRAQLSGRRVLDDGRECAIIIQQENAAFMDDAALEKCFEVIPQEQRRWHGSPPGSGQDRRRDSVIEKIEKNDLNQPLGGQLRS